MALNVTQSAAVQLARARERLQKETPAQKIRRIVGMVQATMGLEASALAPHDLKLVEERVTAELRQAR